MHIRDLLRGLTLLLGLLCSTGLRAHPEPLASAVERLQAAGYDVLYSSDLVEAETSVTLEQVTPGGLIRALRPLGLTLQRVGAQWVIVDAAPAQPGTPVYLRSAADVPLEQPVAHWRGRTEALLAAGDGSYQVPAAPGTMVTVGADRHRSSLVRLRNHQTVVLEPEHLVENVIVTGSRHHLSGRNLTGTVATLDADELVEAPALGNDALRVITELPGMSSVGVSAKPLIRGGVQDELLVRLDGVELLDAYHLADFQNIFSAVDDRAVQSVDVYTGGFPARYGNRMSGVVDIDMGRIGDPPRTELGISVFALLANTQGSLDDGRTRYIASLRRGNLDQVTRAVNPDLGRPRYYDALGRVDRDLGANTLLSVGGFLTRDDVRLEEDETQARSNIDSRYLWLRLDHDHGGNLQSASTLTFTSSDRHKRLNDEDDDDTHAGFLDHRQDLRKLGARTDLRWHGESVLMEFGAELHYGRSHYRSSGVVDRGLVGAVLTGNPAHAHDIDTTPEGAWGGAYWAAEIDVRPDLTLQPGLRWDFQNFDAQGTTSHLSPRLGLRWRPTPTVSVHLDAGRFHQPEALHELQAADGESSFFRPQSADHFIAGIDWLVGAWEVRAELYEKRYRRTKRRYENVFNPFVLVPELEPDRVAVDPQRARARGADLSVHRQLGDRAALRLHYGYMDAEDRLDGDWVPRRWSQRHSAGTVLSWQSNVLVAALAVNWHSGWRGATLPPEVAAGTVLGVADVLNNATLEDYLSVDASVRRTWRVGRSDVTIFASVTNVTGRDNLAGIDYDAEAEDDIVYLEPETETLIPMVPSVGVLISF